MSAVGRDDPTSSTGEAGDEDGAWDDDPTDPDRTDPDGATAVIVTGTAELRECPNCEAPNSSRRSICGRCGADLSTGERPAPRDVGAESAAEESGRLGREGPRTGRLVAMVVVVGVLLGALIGGLIALDTGPFGDTPGGEELPEAPPFDPARYDEEPASLTITAIGATSTLEPLGDETYDAAQMVDRDLETAWNNAGSRNPNGIGEIVAVEFDGPVRVDELVLGNGVQSSDADFLGNARLRVARIRFDGGEVFEVTFLDQPGLQVVELPDPVLTTGAMVDVLEAYDGDTYEDLAIAELRFRGWPAEGRDREVAESRADADS